MLKSDNSNPRYQITVQVPPLIPKYVTLWATATRKNLDCDCAQGAYNEVFYLISKIGTVSGKHVYIVQCRFCHHHYRVSEEEVVVYVQDDKKEDLTYLAY
jgi:hypothetical protein